MTLHLPTLDVRIPGWDRKELAERACPVCRMSPPATAVAIRPDDLVVRLCPRCDTFYISPAPRAAQLDAFYQTYDEKHRRALRLDPARLTAIYQAADPYADLRIRELASLLDVKNARVLDVGFGRGQFLYLLQKLGARPAGYEVDPQAIEFGRQLGFEVYSGQLTDASRGQPYDLITLLDLVEHPLDPLASLRIAAGMLRPGGLLMIWTPNGGHVRRDPGQTTFRVDLEHMQYFTPKSCWQVAMELQLEVEHLETLGFPALAGMDQPVTKVPPPVAPLKRLIRKLPGFSILNRFRLTRLNWSNSGNPLLDDRRGTYHLFCIFQKPVLPQMTMTPKER